MKVICLSTFLKRIHTGENTIIKYQLSSICFSHALIMPFYTLINSDIGLYTFSKCITCRSIEWFWYAEVVYNFERLINVNMISLLTVYFVLLYRTQLKYLRIRLIRSLTLFLLICLLIYKVLHLQCPLIVENDWGTIAVHIAGLFLV